MNRLYWAVIGLLLSVVSQTSLAGHLINNGGDAVRCMAMPNNEFLGTYALDYLVTYRSSNHNADVTDVSSVDASLQHIQQMFDAKVPEFSDRFREFVSFIGNVTDATKPRLWEEAPFGLVQLNDQNLVSMVPENCR